MNSRLFAWELRHLRSDLTAWLLGGLLVVMTLFAVANGAHHLRLQHQAVADSLALADKRIADAKALAQKLDAEKREESPSRDPRFAQGFAHFHLQSYATKPPLGLSVLTKGQSDLYPNANLVALSSRDFSVRGEGVDNPQRLLLGHFDAAFVVVYLLPLLLIALSYNVLSGERERGTLPLLLLQHQSPAPLVARRCLVAGLFSFGLLALLLVAGLHATGSLASAEVGRLVAWLGVAFAYGAFWLALAVFVTSRGGSSATNAVVLASAWLLVTIVAPAVINVIAKRVYPAPSRMDFIVAQRAATDEISHRRSALLAAYFEDHPELAPEAAKRNAPDPQVVAQMSYQETERRLAPIRARFAEQLARQQALIEQLRFVSPALLAQTAFNDLTGTGLASYETYRTQIGAHHDALRAYFQPKILAKEKFAKYDEVPRFAFVDEPTHAVLARAAWPLGALLAISALIVVRSIRSLRRSSPALA